MKKILFVLFAILMITGCGKDDIPPTYLLPDNNSFLTEENIFKEMGCRAKDVKSIRKLWLYVDSLKKERYLYGSKMSNNVENFWVAKFTPQGEQVWETIKEFPGYISNAFYPNIINTGDIVFAKILRTGDIDQREVSPVLVNSKDGAVKSIKVYDGYFYTETYVYKDFFFCSISQQELDVNLNAKDWMVQISNEGEIMSQNKRCDMPEGEMTWTTDSVYICMNPRYIQKGKLYSNSPEWIYNVNLPKHNTCNTKFSINEDEIEASYFLTTENPQQDTIAYRISYRTGKNFINVEGIAFNPSEKGLIIGEEYTLVPIFIPENASFTNIDWTSSNDDIATIDNNGKVKAIGKGECIITVFTKKGSIKATCKIRVTGEYDVNGVYFLNSTERIIQGSSLQLNAVVTPATALNQKIKWYSSDNTIASIDVNGVVTGNTIGTALITAKTEEGEYKATCEVIVADIRDFIDLNFSANITSLINGYVTGSIYSQITNNSTNTIKVTSLTAVDTNSNMIVAMGDQSLLGELNPSSSFSIGGAFYMVYYPKFVWEFEYKGKTYILSHTFLQGSYSTKLTSNKIKDLIWLKK